MRMAGGSLPWRADNTTPVILLTHHKTTETSVQKADGMLAIFAIFGLMQRKKETILRSQIKERREQLDHITMISAGKAEDSDIFWRAANTIYLYAALSQEEAKSNSLKGKPAEILRASEQIIQTIQP